MEKDKHPLDEFFREELKDYQPEPSPAGKEAFLRSADRMLRKEGNRRRWIYLPIAILFLAGAGAGIWFFTTPEPPSTFPMTEQTAANPAVLENPSSGQPVAPPVSSVADRSSYPTEELTLPDHPRSTASEETDNGKVRDISEPVPSEDFPGKKADFFRDIPPSEPGKEEPASLPEVRNAGSDSLTAGNIPAEAPSGDPDTAVEQAKPESKRSRTASARKEISMIIGAQYTPEWMFNTLQGEKFVNNAGLEGTFRFGRYSVRTGVGLSLTEGTNELVIGYNDYLGNYQDLDSITFQWDEKHYYLLPTYYLSEKDVWDEQVSEEQYYLIKRYTYLQIPLFLGYDFIEKGRFSAGIRGGPVLSLLVNSKQLTANYDPGKDKIVMINQVTPDRIQTNWQVAGGINFSYFLHRRILLEIEPEVRYYFNSVYEKSDITQKPWSAGIRVAVGFDLKK